MKLLRLISQDETEADFMCMLQEPITLKPESKICLQNISLFLEDSITVSKDNRGFELVSQSLTDPNLFPVSQAIMNEGTYELPDFLTEVARAANVGLYNPLGPIGVEPEGNFMEITTSSADSKLKISYNLSALTENNHLDFAGVSFDGTVSYEKSATADEDAWAFTNSNILAGLSNGQLYAQAEVSNDNGSMEQIAIGLAPYDTFSNAQKATGADKSMPPQSYTLCVFTKTATASDVYWIKRRDNTETATGCEIQDGDTVQFGQGRMNVDENAAFSTELIIQVKRADGNIVRLYQETSRYNQFYHFGCSFLNETSLIRDIRFSESSLGKQQSGPTGTIPNYSLFFSQGSALLLGFNSRRSEEITGGTGSWTANNTLYETIVPPSILVEIPTIPLMSYDTEVGYNKRRPILAVVPSVELNIINESVAYSAPFPVFIDINNKTSDLLNTIRVRILDTDNQPLRLGREKGASLSVILD